MSDISAEAATAPDDDGVVGAVQGGPDEKEVASGLPILPLRDTVVFPDSLTPLAIGQPRSIKLVDDAVEADRSIALVAGRLAEGEAASSEDIYAVGVVASIQKLIRVPDGTLRVLVQASERVRMAELTQTDPYLVGRFEPAPDMNVDGKEVEALARSVEALFTKIIGLLPLPAR